MATGFPAHLREKPEPEKENQRIVGKERLLCRLALCGGFIMLKGSAVSHQLTGAVLNQAVGTQRVGKEGTDTIIYTLRMGR